jgi:hypothetical protein
MAEPVSYLVGGGQFSGPSATPMGSGVARVLGLQGGALPGIAAAGGAVVPVLVVGDTSNAASRSLFARRFFSGRVTTPGAGNVVRILFRSNPTAAAVIERFRVASNAAALAQPIGFGTSSGNLGLGLGAFVAIGASEVGAQVPGSVNYLGWGPQTQIGVTLGFGTILVPPDTFEFTEREWFIPAGGSFMAETNDVAVAIRWSIQWREIPE